MICATVVCLVASSVPAVSLQQLRFNATVDLVRVPVTALDPDGRPVRGLQAADFEVFEDGVKRPIVAFEEVRADGRSPVAVTHTAFEDVAENSWSDSDLLIALLVDEYAARDRLPTIQALARKVAEAVPVGVPMTVLTLNETAEVEVTTDRARVLERIDRVEEIARRVVFTTPRLVRNETSVCPWNKIASAARALQSAAHVRRKVLIYVSPFCSDSYQEREESREAARAMQKANVSFMSVDPRGAVGYSLGNFLPPNLVGSRGNAGVDAARRARETRSWDPVLNSQKSAIEFATVTGGVALTNRDDLDTAIPKTIADFGSYYLLGFTPKVAEAVVRSLEVRAGRDGVSLRYQRSHQVAPAPASPAARTANAMVSGLVPTGTLPIRGFAAARPAVSGDSTVDVILETPRGALPAPERVTAVVHAVDLWKEIVTRSSALQFSGVDDASGQLRYTGMLALPAGSYQLRAALFDRETDTGGSVYLSLDVPQRPETGRLAVGHLSLARLQDGQPALTLDREFTTADRLLVRTTAAGRLKRTAPLSARLRIAGADGKSRGEQRVEAVGDADVYGFSFEVKLAGLPSDHYSIRIDIADVPANVVSLGLRVR